MLKKNKLSSSKKKHFVTEYFLIDPQILTFTFDIKNIEWKKQQFLLFIFFSSVNSNVSRAV